MLECRRSLLDTEKLVFRTSDAEKLVRQRTSPACHEHLTARSVLKWSSAVQDSQHFVELKAEATGIHRDGPDALPTVFHYNIGETQQAFRCHMQYWLCIGKL